MFPSVLELPDSFDKVKEKDEKLHANLQSVFVTSIGENKVSNLFP